MINPTPKQAVKMFKNKTLTFHKGDIQSIKQTCGKTAWIDNRTVHRPFPEPADVYPFAVDSTHVYIICPWCRRIHVHGRGVGGRVSHCKPPNYHPDYRIMPI